MELLNLLTSQLDVNQEQAKGGAGMLFKLAQDQLGSGEFAKVASAVPGIGDMISAAPKEEESGGGLMGAIGGLASSLGGGDKLGTLGVLAQAAGGFSKLGLSPDMVGKFLPIIMSFVQSKGGDEIKGLLAKVLK